jgi:hypothetical protein
MVLDSVGVTPPVLPPVVPTLAPAGIADPVSTDFFRSPAGGGAAGGGGESAHHFTEQAPPAPRAPTATATPEPTVAFPAEFSTLRTLGSVVETAQPATAEIETEAARPEMTVATMRHGLDLSDQDAERLEIVVTSVRITGIALSVGAVWWAARAAGLLASLLASSPAWRHLDPLPVLGRDDEDNDGWDEELSAEDQAKRDEEHRAAWVLEGKD